MQWIQVHQQTLKEYCHFRSKSTLLLFIYCDYVPHGDEEDKTK